MRPSIFQPRGQAHTVRDNVTQEALTRAHHEQVIELARAGFCQHMHLDWHILPDLLASPGLRGQALIENGVLRAVLGATIHLDARIDDISFRSASAGAAWLRLAILDEANSAPGDLDRLWNTLSRDLRRDGVFQVYLLLLDGWIRGLAERWGFRRSNAVVTLRRTAETPPRISYPNVVMRAAAEADLDAITAVDARTFGPLWHYSRETLAEAARQAATWTVAEDTSGIVGYQLSTYHMNTGHLARLAVDPDRQGRGYGLALTAEMLSFFHQNGITTVTVNTQEDNYASQRVYERLGFRRTGFDVPLLTLTL